MIFYIIFAKNVIMLNNVYLIVIKINNIFYVKYYYMITKYYNKYLNYKKKYFK